MTVEARDWRSALGVVRDAVNNIVMVLVVIGLVMVLVTGYQAQPEAITLNVSESEEKEVVESEE